ncbi:MAG: nitroreductase/quinone reductase family protein [Actinomycetota bacterium]
MGGKTPVAVVPRFSHSAPARAFGWAAKKLAKVGVPGLAVLTTTGRRSGLDREVPVSPLRHEGATYLVSPYGQVSWVHNVRADPRVKLRQGGNEREVVLREVTEPEVLLRYYRSQPVASRFMEIPGKRVLDDFASVAHRFPVFRVDE